MSVFYSNKILYYIILHHLKAISVLWYDKEWKQKENTFKISKAKSIDSFVSSKRL